LRYRPGHRIADAFQGVCSAIAAGLLLATAVVITKAPKDDDHARGSGAPGGLGGNGGMDT